MTADVFKTGPYAVVSPAGSVPSAPGYAVLSPERQVSSAPTYVVVAPPAQALAVPTYAIVSVQGSTPSATTYAVLRSFYPPHSGLVLNFPFIDQRFPECVSFGSSGGPGFKTSVFELDSGYTGDTIEWESIRARYNVTFENATPSDIAEVSKFFYGMRGKAIGFRYKDWSDYQISNQNVFVGDGVTKDFQIFKRYASGGYYFDRFIKKIVLGTFTELTLDGVSLVYETDFFVNHYTGTIHLATAPAAGTVGKIVYAEFDVPVRFDTDYLDVSYDEHQMLSIASLPLVEIIV